MACMILCRTFHITPGLGQGKSLGKTQMGAIPIFQALKIFPVMSCNWFQLQYLCFLYFFTVVCSQNGMPTCRNILTKCTKIRKNKDLMNLYWCYLMWDLWIINCDIWFHPMNVERSLKGEFYTHCADLHNYEDRFFEFYWMTTQQFDYILERIAPLIIKKHSNF